MNSKVFCGLCQKWVDDWPSHRISLEHIENLGDVKKVGEAFAEHDEEVAKIMKAAE